MAMTDTLIFFDPDLGQKLKDFRLKNNIKAKDVATHIHKSAAYISKLENGQIKQVRKQELSKILNFITGQENGYELFIETNIKEMDINELDKSTTILNFDWIDRKIPIPQEYINFVSSQIQSLDITSTELTQYINSNEDLDEHFLIERNIDINHIQYNYWYSYNEADSHSINRTYILVKLNGDLLSNIISKSIDKTSYLFLFTIVYHLYKIKEKKIKTLLTQYDIDNLKKKTQKLLNKYKIYTISEKQKAIIAANNEIEIESKLSSFDFKNRQLINDLNAGIFYLSEKDIDYVNNKLEHIIINLKESNSFSLAYMALDLSPLTNISFSKKKEFLNTIQQLIDSYAKLADSDFEKY